MEKFNGILKKMLKVYVVKEFLKWDKYFFYVLFVYREVLNEIIGFFFFEMFFVR